MADGDKAAQQAVAIDVALEQLDPAAHQPVAAVPIATGILGQMRAQITAIERGIILIHRRTKEAEEALIIRHMAQPGQLEPDQVHMMVVEIDRDHLCRVRSQIGQHITAAGTDGDHPAAGLQLQYREVNIRVFPYLRIDKSLEGSREHPLEQTGAGPGLVLMHGLTQTLFRCFGGGISGGI